MENNLIEEEIKQLTYIKECYFTRCHVAIGNAGEIRLHNNYMYVCIEKNNWKRIDLVGQQSS